jgi:prolyl-tRNA editing enzyme YbaK/EbsC (Cys-tRNA(Pro) deacylase)
MSTLGKLELSPVADRPDLLASPVASAIVGVPDAMVAPIDPELADTAALCAAYDVAMDASANCVVVTGRRAGVERHAGCVVLATTRADVNGLVRRRLEARKASFASVEFVTEATAMEYGGITPVGLPAEWPLLVDAAVVRTEIVVIGSGLRRSKVVLPGAALADLPGAEVIEGLGHAPT